MSRVNLSQEQKRFYDRIVARNRVHGANTAKIIYTTEGKSDDIVDISGGKGKKTGAAKYIGLKQKVGSSYESILEIQLLAENESTIETFETNFSGVNMNEATGMSPFAGIGSEHIQDMILVQEQGNKNNTVALKAIAAALDAITRQYTASQIQIHQQQREMMELRNENLRLQAEAVGGDNSSLAMQSLGTLASMMEKKSEQDQSARTNHVVPQQRRMPVNPQQQARQTVPARAPQQQKQGVDLSSILDLLPQFNIDPSEIPAEKYKNLFLMSQKPETTLADYFKEFMRDDEPAAEPPTE